MLDLDERINFKISHYIFFLCSYNDYRRFARLYIEGSLFDCVSFQCYIKDL